MAITIRLLAENEALLANDFFNKIYGTDRPLENFRWEFIECPFGKAVYVVAIDSSELTATKIIGIQCAIPIELVGANGDVVLTAKSEDTLVDPDYRGQKVFERMYDMLFEECRRVGIHYIWGFTPAKKAFERIGFEIPFMTQQALMVFNPFIAYAQLSVLNPKNKFLDKVKIAGLCFISFLKSLVRNLIFKGNLSAESIQVDSPPMINTKHNLFSLNMSKQYLEWRLVNNPFHNNYERLHIWNVNNLIADVILNYRSVGYIEQIIFSPEASTHDKQETIGIIINRIVKKVGLIRILCFDTSAELKSQVDIFKRCGFVIVNKGGHFVWKPLTTESIKPNQLFLSRLFTQGNQ